MPNKKYLVPLNADEREQLEPLLHSGTHATRTVTRTRLLRQAAEGMEDSASAVALSVGRATVERPPPALCRRGPGDAGRNAPAPGNSPSGRRRPQPA